jgi:hypothetical protein
MLRMVPLPRRFVGQRRTSGGAVGSSPAKRGRGTVRRTVEGRRPRRSVLPHGDEARGGAQHVALGAHSGRVDRGNRLIDQTVEFAARALEA